MVRTLIFLIKALLCLSFAQTTFAINPDFYKQKQKKEALKVQRERGARARTRIRKKTIKVKEKRAKAYTKKRVKILNARKKREKLFDKDLAKKEKFKSRKISQANKYAKIKRKKSKVGWKEQNLEYDIQVLEPKNKPTD
ncbi:MAG: hypothetical protein ACRBBP_05150 [Bdellovibrionales bacterium]